MTVKLPTIKVDHQTKRPTGITITREGANFTITWKHGDKNIEWQNLDVYLLAGTQGKYIHTGRFNKNKNKYTFKWTDYYQIDPLNNKRATSVIAYISGKREDYEESYTKKVKVNGKKQTGKGTKKHKYSESSPAVTEMFFVAEKPTGLSWGYGSGDYSSVFSWSARNDAGGNYWHWKMQVQSMLVANCSEGDGSKLNWGSASSEQLGLNSSKTINETSGSVSTGSHTRWVRCRVVGVEALTAWIYKERVFAYPHKAVITKTEGKHNDGSVWTYVAWKNTINNTNPAETADVEYVIVTPEANVTCPDDQSFTNGRTIVPKNGENSVSFITSSDTGLDKALFARVNLNHDLYTTTGDPKLVAVGALKDPEVTGIDPNPQTHKVTITVANHSEVPDAFVAIYYKQGNKPNDTPIVAIVPAGETEATGVQCPNWGSNSYTFGARAFVGTATAQNRPDGVKVYSVNAKMKSGDIQWLDTTIPRPPLHVNAEQVAGKTGTVKLTWDWSWSEANIAEIAWSDHDDAWESTDAPDSFEVTNNHTASWNVAGLEAGKIWYFRVRLIKETADGRVISGWSLPTTECSLASAPQRPVLILSKGTVSQDDYIVANWAFISTDGTAQIYAEVCEAEISGQGIIYGEPIVKTESAQNVEILISQLGWQNGSTHYLAVRTTSGSGQTSPWSEPVALTIASPLDCQITATSLADETETWIDDETGEETERHFTSLKEMPLSVTVAGAGTAGKVTVAIEREENYSIRRPDEKEDDGYEGEIIAQQERAGDGTIEITSEELFGRLDDGAKYRIVATIKDSAGQSATALKIFEVHWTNQAIMPSAEVEYDDDYLAAIITPQKPAGATEGDTFDIYRLSADQPEKIIEHGDWDTVYVDPYPAIGESGNHRIVFISKDGDYITEDEELAMFDTEGEYMSEDCIVIDFGNKQLKLYANIDYSNNWAKDFKDTKYLGGSIQGDWNKGVSRTGSASTFTVRLRDMEQILKLKDLAVYEGECHVRTPDGSSFTANVDVAETNTKFNEIASYTLSYTRVDGATLDGITEEEWEERKSEME